MTRILPVVFMLLISSGAYAQGPAAEFDKFVDEAIANTQQVGEFYFIPLPINHGFWPGDRYVPWDGEYHIQRTRTAQLVLRILNEFQNRKGLDIVSFEVQRDPRANSSVPRIHGIFVKAVTKNKK